MILANFGNKAAYYNILDKYIGGEILSQKFCSLITSSLEVDLQSLEDTELNNVLVNRLVLVATKIFRKSEGIETIEDFYVTFRFMCNIIYRSCVLASPPSPRVYPSELFCCAQENLRFWPSKPKSPSEPS